LVQTKEIQSITGDGFTIGVVSRNLLLDQSQWLLFRPAMQVRLPFSAPPDFIFKAQGYLRVVFSQPN
jgi:hypothetical protein